jgi:hypothetical protein
MKHAERQGANITLFTRYKRFINENLDFGNTTYTAANLNHMVGDYENPTLWKRWHNNRFYTTRTYQTVLRDLGCISKIKRGLWKINGPIPEWFGSYHFKGLNRGFAEDNKWADHNCEYWKSLPEEHKINPWKTAVLEEPKQARLEDLIDASTGEYTPNLKTKTTDIMKRALNVNTVNADESSITIDGAMSSCTVNFTVTAPFGLDIHCNSWINIHPDKQGIPFAEVAETEMHLALNPTASYSEILNLLNLMMGQEASDLWLKSVDDYAAVKALEMNRTSTPVAVPDSSELFTKEQVRDILRNFVNSVDSDVKSAVEDAVSSVDADDAVELEFESYNRSISVSLNTSQFEHHVADAVHEQLINAIEFFDFEKTAKN